MRKLQPKISGRFRTMKGAMIFPRLRSIVNAARKRGWNVIDILGGSPEKSSRRSIIRQRFSTRSKIA